MHRDIKPKNIAVLASDGGAVLLDFDVACMSADRIERKGKCGTPGYIAPEVLVGRTYCCSVDLFSVGCVFYYLFARRQPFHTVPYSETAINRKTVLCEYDFGPRFDAVDPSCKELISSLLQRQPGQRLRAHEALQHSWLIARASRREDGREDNDSLARCARNTHIAQVGREKLQDSASVTAKGSGILKPILFESLDGRSVTNAQIELIEPLAPCPPKEPITRTTRPSNFYRRINNFPARIDA
eukprot:TRINITY_DN18362_c0_g1_i1.p1 TRINITY_DN18362_c0_g1~~TRINITY_DN18362_c0_g1_i1.p1  ORF type:complete len:242 (-),score=13.37 TRINITY_DN18362_c0_g1_i1:71-796(-)